MSPGEIAVLTVVGSAALVAVLAALLTWASHVRYRHMAHRQVQQVAKRMAREAHLWTEPETPEASSESTVSTCDRPPTGPRRCVVWPSQGADGHTTSPRHAKAS